ncbi:MAG: hypothetical protein KDC87_21850, partial [Planctomycetes bacterium]|nr:hypothetical protein [Planctomycetota bacterium]
FERAAPTASGRTTRLRAVAGDDSLASLEGMVAQLRTAVQQRDRYRAMLEKIAELIRDELGEGDD